MGHTRTPLPVKLFIGMLSPDPGLFSVCETFLTAEYGPVDMESEIMPWDVTSYYHEEMGSPIFRKFFFFQKLIDPEILAPVKIMTNRVEEQHALFAGSRYRRKINIDPGYVTEAKVVLATTKDFSHRVYIGSSIYAEVTLCYSREEENFSHLDHTYYDFRTAVYKNLFKEARSLLRKSLER